MNGYTKPESHDPPKRSTINFASWLGFCPDALGGLSRLEQRVIPSLTLLALLVSFVTHTLTQLLTFAELTRSIYTSLVGAMGVACAIAVYELSVSIYLRNADAREWQRKAAVREASSIDLSHSQAPVRVKRLLPFLFPMLFTIHLTVNGIEWVFRSDIREIAAEIQAKNDQPILVSEGVLLDKREKQRLENHIHQVAVWERYVASQDNREQQHKLLARQIADADAELAAMSLALNEAQKQRACELGGITDFNCKATLPDKGPRWHFHNEEVERLTAAIERVERSLETKKAEMQEFDSVASIPERPVYLPQGVSERQAALHKALMESPDRRVIDPDTKSVALTALASIVSISVLHAIYVIGTGLAIFGLQTVGLLALLLLRSEKYIAELGLSFNQHDYQMMRHLQQVAEDEYELAGHHMRNRSAWRVVKEHANHGSADRMSETPIN